MNIVIPDEVNYLLEIFKKEDEQAYIVGGCVRDSLMNIKPNDWDICTSANPDKIVDILNKYDIKAIKTGVKYGTITAIFNNNCYEITTFRDESAYSDNRRPNNVNFIKDINKDLSRRDFTINAMAYNVQSGLIDLFNGKSDIENKIVKCVGDADERFKEDALRIMRALRFASVLCFEIDGKTKNAIMENMKKLKNVSYERINCELCKLLCGEDASKLLFDYKEVFAIIIPEITKCFNFNQKTTYHIYDVWEHTTKAIGYCCNDLIIRLTILFHDIGKPYTFTVDNNGVGHFYGHSKESARIAKEILKRLHFDNATINTVFTLILYHDIIVNENKKSVKKWLNKIGKSNFQLLLRVKYADIMAHNPKYTGNKLENLKAITKIYEDILSNNECFSLKDLNINGDDLIKLGISNGKTIGEILNITLKYVMNDKISNTKSELIKFVTNYNFKQ